MQGSLKQHLAEGALLQSHEMNDANFYLLFEGKKLFFMKSFSELPIRILKPKHVLWNG